jgi:glycine reductase
MSGVRVVHYVNQFFGQLGGEEHADAAPQIRPGAVGPGRVLERLLSDGATLVATVVCGDNRFADSPEETAAQIVEMLREHAPGVLVAGPAFDAGRYGLACGHLCAAVQERLGIPAVTGMSPENPAVELFRDRVLIARTGASARSMAEALNHLARLAMRLGSGERIHRPADADCFARGLKRSVFLEQPAARRAVDLLLRKLAGATYQSEISIPRFDTVTPAPPPADLSRAVVAVVTDGGLIHAGNPEGMPAGFTDRSVALSVAARARLDPETFDVHHGGYDTRFVKADPNRLVPIDALRDLEAEGFIGRLFDTVYSTAGLGMSLTNARRLGRDIAWNLKRQGVEAVILTSA